MSSKYGEGYNKRIIKNNLIKRKSININSILVSVLYKVFIYIMIKTSKFVHLSKKIEDV